MFESLYEVSATLALGGFFLFGTLVIIEIGKRDVLKTFLNTYYIPQFFAASLGFSLTFIAGVFLEVLSDDVAENFTILFQPIGTEQKIRTQALLSTPGLDNRLRYHGEYIRYARCVLTAEEVASVEKYVKNHPNPGLAELSKSTPNCAEKLVNDLFYEAKNRVYQDKNYFSDLSELERRIKFLRGVALACFLLLISLIGVGLYRIVSSKKRYWEVTIPITIVLITLYASARYAYTQEAKTFAKKVFGYYLVVECTKTPEEAFKIGEAKMSLSPSNQGQQQLRLIRSEAFPAH
jgi:hypothetical protein